MNKEDILKSLDETIRKVESMPSDEFAKKWFEVSDDYEESNLLTDVLSDVKYSESVIDMDVTPSTYKTVDNTEDDCSVAYNSGEEIDTLNIGLAA